MNNYYTPTIDEFHVGFECEFYYKYGDPRDIGDWIKIKLKLTDYFHIVGDDDFEVRVKYLDKEDLIDLGFAHVGGKLLRADLLQDYTLYNGRYYVHLTYSRFQEWASIRIETSVEKNSVRTIVVHSIKIKNKSELVKLMKQLNVV